MTSSSKFDRLQLCGPEFAFAALVLIGTYLQPALFPDLRPRRALLWARFQIRHVKPLWCRFCLALTLGRAKTNIRIDEDSASPGGAWAVTHTPLNPLGVDIIVHPPVSAASIVSHNSTSRRWYLAAVV